MTKDVVIGGFNADWGLYMSLVQATNDDSMTYSQNFYWRDYCHGQIPFDALEASSGLYIGQTHFDKGNIPAAIYPFRNSAIAMDGPRHNVKEHVKILRTSEPKNFYWDSVNFNDVDMTAMKDAVVGGYQEDWLLYIGRVYHLNSWKLGKVFDAEVTDWQGVYVWSKTEGLPEGVYWRDYIPCEIPDDAFEAAPGLYIGQALYLGNLLVTTIYPHTGTAVGELGGQKNFKHNIKILCTMWPDKLCWEFVNFSEPIKNQMKDVVKGGYEEGIGSELYIGKNLLHKEWKIGKVIEMMHPSKGLYLWSENAAALRQYQFHMLKYNCTSNK